MYKNLEAEMSRNSISSDRLAETINKSYNTIRLKMLGKNEFTLREALTIRRELFPSLSLDYLFEEDEGA